MRLIDTNTGQTIVGLGETHRAELDAGECVCGWTANGPYVPTETWDHLFGDLDWIPRRKLEDVVGIRPLAMLGGEK